MPLPHGGEVRRPAVAHGQHEVRAEEDVDLAELDLLHVVEVGRGAEHDEQRVAVALELRPLVRDDRVLDGELVQPELLGDRHELGGGRPEQADPGHRALLLAQPLRRPTHRRRGLDPLAVAVDGGVDHALLDRVRRRPPAVPPSRPRAPVSRRVRMRTGAPAQQSETRSSVGHGGSPAPAAGTSLRPCCPEHDEAPAGAAGRLGGPPGVMPGGPDVVGWRPGVQAWRFPSARRS